jgi:hypothetical protein
VCKSLSNAVPVVQVCIVPVEGALVGHVAAVAAPHLLLLHSHQVLGKYLQDAAIFVAMKKI